MSYRIEVVVVGVVVGHAAVLAPARVETLELNADVFTDVFNQCAVDEAVTREQVLDGQAVLGADEDLRQVVVALRLVPHLELTASSKLEDIVTCVHYAIAIIYYV